MAVWVLDPNTAVVGPTSIPLREVLVLPDAETHITHRQQHTPTRAQIFNTKCTAYACVSCQKLFFPARVEMYCTIHNARSLGTESVFLKLHVCFCRSLLDGGMLISRIVAPTTLSLFRLTHCIRIELHAAGVSLTVCTRYVRVYMYCILLLHLKYIT